LCCDSRRWGLGGTRGKERVLLSLFLFHKYILCVCRRGEQGLVTETPRGEIQIPQRSGKMVAETILFVILLTFDNVNDPELILLQKSVLVTLYSV
jgi:hypothetical protein